MDKNLEIDNPEKVEKKVLPLEVIDDDFPIITDSFLQLTEEFNENKKRLAPVKIPNSEDLTVVLVNKSLLHRLDEVRSDVHILSTLFFMFIAGILGFLINIFTSNQGIEKSGWVFLALLTVVSITFGLLWVRSQKRVTEFWKQIDGNNQAQNES